MHTKKFFTIRTLALIGVLSALVYALSMVSIPIGDVSRIHFGNIMCLLAGSLFGPVVGGLSAGLGSMFFDLSNPVYMTEFWITFLTKFAMGFVAGMLSRRLEGRVPASLRYPMAALGGQLVYILLYLFKSALMLHYVNGNAWVAVWPQLAAKGVISGINGAIAVVACALFAPALRAALDAAGLFRERRQRPVG